MVKIIAEFCQNHNGDFDLLKKMIEEAAKAGATHGKMQTIFANTLAYRPQFEEGLIQNGTIKSIKRPYQDEYNRLKKLEISNEETVKFINICLENGLIPMTTCFVRSHVNHLANLGFNSIKIASYDCASFPLIRDLGNNFNEIIVSTGASYDDEVIYTSNLLKGKNFAMLHCVTQYPTPLDKMHLSRMEWLKELAPEVGYSDHSLVKTTGIIASKAALALGAQLIERHFTILPADKTRDGPVSIGPNHLKQLVDFSKLSIKDRVSLMDHEIPEWRMVIGQKHRKLTHEELLNRDYYRGRFAIPREDSVNGSRMINNWEETSLI